MLISDLKNNIVTGDINNFYIFTGPEEGIMDIFIKQIAKKKNLVVKWEDSIKEVSKLASLKSLVQVKYLYLVRIDKDFKTQENLWPVIKQVKGHYVILIQPEIDKRSSKFVKYFEDCTIKFDKLSPDLLVGYGRKVCPSMSSDNMHTLTEWCGCSYLRFMNELDKIKTLGKVMSISDDKAFEVLVSDNGIYKEREFDVFKYVNYITTRNVHACYEDYEYVKVQQSEILIVSLLLASFRNLMLLKNDGGGKGVCDRTGLTGWQIKCASEIDEYFRIDECENNILLLQDTEVKIKTGVLTPDIALNYILAEIL